MRRSMVKRPARSACARACARPICPEALIVGAATAMPTCGELQLPEIADAREAGREPGLFVGPPRRGVRRVEAGANLHHAHPEFPQSRERALVHPRPDAPALELRVHRVVADF